MYIGSQSLMKKYDQCLLDNGYTILELVDKVSQCLLKHMNGEYFSLLCGPGNNGADGLSPVYQELYECIYKSVHRLNPNKVNNPTSIMMKNRLELRLLVSTNKCPIRILVPISSRENRWGYRAGCSPI